MWRNNWIRIVWRSTYDMLNHPLLASNVSTLVLHACHIIRFTPKFARQAQADWEIKHIPRKKQQKSAYSNEAAKVSVMLGSESKKKMQKATNPRSMSSRYVLCLWRSKNNEKKGQGRYVEGCATERKGRKMKLRNIILLQNSFVNSAMCGVFERLQNILWAHLKDNDAEKAVDDLVALERQALCHTSWFRGSH